MNLDSALEELVGAPAASVVEEGGGSLAWANDVVWANDHIGAQPTLAVAGTQRRYRLWVSANENTWDFTKQLLMQAFKIQEQHKKQQPDADIIEEEERKTIAELQAVLRRVTAKVKEEHAEST